MRTAAPVRLRVLVIGKALGDIGSMERRTVNRQAIERKRNKAIKTLRDMGMADAEIEEELGFL